MTDKVTQADRDAAALLATDLGSLTRQERALILSGSDDSSCYVQAFAHHRTNTNTELVEALREATAFIDNYFAPWGAWKTAWWEGAVSDDAAYSPDNALKHVANNLRKALSLYGDER